MWVLSLRKQEQEQLTHFKPQALYPQCNLISEKRKCWQENSLKAEWNVGARLKGLVLIGAAISLQ